MQIDQAQETMDTDVTFEQPQDATKQLYDILKIAFNATIEERDRGNYVFLPEMSKRVKQKIDFPNFDEFFCESIMESADLIMRGSFSKWSRSQ